MKHTRILRTAGWLAVAGLLSAALIAPSAATAASFNGAIWTSLADGSSVNANIYEHKSDVYLNGGPQNCGQGNGLPDGNYFFQVTDPSGDTLLSSDAVKFRQVQVVNGVIDGVSGAGNHEEGTDGCNGGTPVQLMPYDDTPNNGGEYSVDMAPVADVEACEGFNADAVFNFHDCNPPSKNDNFKVGETTTTTTTSSTSTTSTISSETTSSTTVSSETTSTTSKKPKTTPPPTDTLTSSTTSGSSIDGWRLLLLGMAGVLGATLLLSPVTASRKR